MGEIGAGIITVSDKGSRGERKDLSIMRGQKSGIHIHSGITVFDHCG